MTTLTAEKVYDYCQEYCAILRTSLIQWRINMHRNSILQGNDDSEYHARKIEMLLAGEDQTLDEYVIEEGKKYYKIVQVSCGKSVHAFVNKSNGDVYKSASWKAPVRDARYNLLLDDARAVLFNSVDPFGGYLYKR